LGNGSEKMPFLLIALSLKQLAIVTDENQELQKSLVAAELASNVQEQAARGLQTQLTELLTEKAELEDAGQFLSGFDGGGQCRRRHPSC
jgi:hypothetical protein